MSTSIVAAGHNTIRDSRLNYNFSIPSRLSVLGIHFNTAWTLEGRIVWKIFVLGDFCVDFKFMNFLLWKLLTKRGDQTSVWLCQAEFQFNLVFPGVLPAWQGGLNAISEKEVEKKLICIRLHEMLFVFAEKDVRQTLLSDKSSKIALPSSDRNGLDVLYRKSHDSWYFYSYLSSSSGLTVLSVNVIKNIKPQILLLSQISS